MSKPISLEYHIDFDDDNHASGFHTIEDRCPRCYSENSLIVMDNVNIIHTQSKRIQRMHIRCVCCPYKTTGEYKVDDST